MSITKQWTAPEGVYKERIDKLLSDAFSEHSRADFQRAFDQELVLIDGAAVPKNKRISAGQVVTFSMPDVQKLDMGPVAMALDIVFEDEHMVVVNKPAGLVVHPGAGTVEPTLAHGLLHHCAGQLSGIGGVERPGIVHRLDRETSGLIMAAKTDVAHRALSALFESRALKKEYLALACGVPKLLSGTIDKPIERHPTQRHKMRIGSADRDGSRRAVTDWRVLRSYDLGYTLFRCRIHTGRTHQIRIHLKSLGHVILGDTTYGYKPLSRLPSQPPRVMLHSALLELVHPITNEPLKLEAPLPEDFRSFTAT